MDKPITGRSGASESLLARPIVAVALDAAEQKELRRVLAAPTKLKKKASDLLNRFLLAEVVNLVQSSLSLDEHLHRLIALAAATLNAERGTIFLYDAEHDELFSRETVATEIEEIRIPRSTGIAGAVFNLAQPAIVHDAYSDSRFNPSASEMN